MLVRNLAVAALIATLPAATAFAQSAPAPANQSGPSVNPTTSSPTDPAAAGQSGNTKGTPELRNDQDGARHHRLRHNDSARIDEPRQHFSSGPRRQQGRYGTQALVGYLRNYQSPERTEIKSLSAVISPGLADNLPLKRAAW